LNPDQLIAPASLPKVIGRSRGNLPHLHKEGCTYFVTFCLDDAVDRHRERPKHTRDADDVAGVTERSEPDPAFGSCVLADASVANMVEGALLHFQGDRYALSAWCVMPNHVHVVVTPATGFSLSRILHSWKSYTAHQINRSRERVGRVWEKESFDHLVRTQHAFEHFVEYIEANPVVAGLCNRPDQWPFSSARFRTSDS
jgi:REP element-mobilizing transposase RayT